MPGAANRTAGRPFPPFAGSGRRRPGARPFRKHEPSDGPGGRMPRAGPIHQNRLSKPPGPQKGNLRNRKTPARIPGATGSKRAGQRSGRLTADAVRRGLGPADRFPGNCPVRALFTPSGTSGASPLQRSHQQPHGAFLGRPPRFPPSGPGSGPGNGETGPLRNCRSRHARRSGYSGASGGAPVPFDPQRRRSRHGNTRRTQSGGQTCRRNPRSGSAPRRGNAEHLAHRRRPGNQSRGFKGQGG